MTKAQPVWQELPLHFKKDVVGYLNIKSRLNLQLCSKNDRDVVKMCPLEIKRIAILTYHESPESHIQMNLFIKSTFEERSIVFETIQTAVMNFIELLSNSKMTCTRLNFEYRDSEFARKFCSVFRKSLESPSTIKVSKFFTVVRGSEFLELLSLLNPKSLKSICFFEHSVILRKLCDEIVQTEHWKHLKNLKIYGTQHDFKVEELCHLERFSVDGFEFSKDGFSMLIESFQTRNLPVDSCFHVEWKQPTPHSLLLPNLPAKRVSENRRFYNVTYPTTSQNLVLTVSYIGSENNSNLARVVYGYIEDERNKNDQNGLPFKVYISISNSF